MIPRFLMVAGTAIWLISNPAGVQGFSSGNPQNIMQAAPNMGGNMGDVTCALLKAQRGGMYTDESVPLRREQATLAYQRYPDSLSRLISGLSQTALSAKSISSSQAITAR